MRDGRIKEPCSRPDCTCQTMLYLAMKTLPNCSVLVSRVRTEALN